MANNYIRSAFLFLHIVCYVVCQENTEVTGGDNGPKLSSPTPAAPSKADEVQADQQATNPQTTPPPSEAPAVAEDSKPAAQPPAEPSAEEKPTSPAAAIPEPEKTQSPGKDGKGNAGALLPSLGVALSCAVLSTFLRL